MSISETMTERHRRAFSPEFKAELRGLEIRIQTVPVLHSRSPRASQWASSRARSSATLAPYRDNIVRLRQPKFGIADTSDLPAASQV